MDDQLHALLTTAFRRLEHVTATYETVTNMRLLFEVQKRWGGGQRAW